MTDVQLVRFVAGGLAALSLYTIVVCATRPRPANGALLGISVVLAGLLAALWQ